MVVYDVTRPLSLTLPVYPGDPLIEIVPIAQCTWGDTANVSRLVLTSHSGTHIDAPRHLFDDGTTLDRLDIEVLIGNVRVVELTDTRHITPAGLADLDWSNISRVCFKTPNSELWALPGFQTDYLALTLETAQQLVRHQVKLVGIDYLSVDAFDADTFPVHRTLLSAGVVILEGLDFRGVPAGDYELIALPILLQDGDGAPARVILRSLPESVSNRRA